MKHNKKKEHNCKSRKHDDFNWNMKGKVPAVVEDCCWLDGHHHTVHPQTGKRGHSHATWGANMVTCRWSIVGVIVYALSMLLLKELIISLPLLFPALFSFCCCVSCRCVFFPFVVVFSICSCVLWLVFYFLQLSFFNFVIVIDTEGLPYLLAFRLSNWNHGQIHECVLGSPPCWELMIPLWEKNLQL